MLGFQCHDGCPLYTFQENNTRGNSMLKSIWNIATAASLLCGGTAVVHAYSSGAGQCIGGMAAVGAPHMTSTAVTGELWASEVTVDIGDQSNVPAPKILLNTDTTITLRTVGVFRGVLIRASSPDGVEFTFEPVGDTAQVAAVCTDPGVLGITHTSNALKSEFSGTLNAATTGTITLDITVVLAQNSVQGSSYFYSPLPLPVVDATPAPAASAPQNLTPTAPSAKPKPPSTDKAPTKSGAVVGASTFTTLGWIIMVVATMKVV
jgi:hypothetical protein